MSSEFPVSVDPDSLREFREELEEMHQEMENLAIALERNPADLTPLGGVREYLQQLCISAAKLGLVPLSESLDDALKAVDLLLGWGTFPPRMAEFILLFIDRLRILARDVEQEQVIDMRKTQHLLVALQYLVLASGPQELHQRTEDAIAAITREIYEHLGEQSAETDILLFDGGQGTGPSGDGGGVELFGEDAGIELFGEGPAGEARESRSRGPDAFVPAASRNPLEQAREFISGHDKAGIWQVLGHAADNATPFRGPHTGFTLHLVLAINFLAGGPLDPEGLYLGVCVHDLGLAPLAHILGSGRSLTAEEREAVEQHPLKAVPLVRELSGSETAERLVLEHHERVNGSGYPHGLKGEAISEAARLMAIVDSFQPMIESRPHKPYGRSVLRAVAEINACAGSLYDPRWVGHFNRCIRDWWLPEQRRRPQQRIAWPAWA